MAGITLAQAEARLTAYLSAEEKILGGQTVEMTVLGNSRRLTRADLASVQSGVNLWEKRVQRLSRGAGVSFTRVIVND